ncbi:MAG: hypothetical protein WC549_01845 [Actinomycetota bacterium]
MNYSEIIGQVAENMNYDGLSNELTRNIRFAIFWALQELTATSNALKADYEFAVFADKKEYPLPSDFVKPRKVIISSEGVGLNTVEVEYEELLVFELGLNPDLNIRYANSTLYAFRKIDEGNSIFIYPALKGKCYISYDKSIGEPIEFNGNMTPPIPHMFHRIIIDGATFYLARRKITEIAKIGNPELLNSWLAAVKSYGETFTTGKETYTVYSQQRAEPALIKGHNFYDKPEEYI